MRRHDPRRCRPENVVDDGAEVLFRPSFGHDGIKAQHVRCPGLSLTAVSLTRVTPADFVLGGIARSPGTRRTGLCFPSGGRIWKYSVESIDGVFDAVVRVPWSSFVVAHQLGASGANISENLFVVDWLLRNEKVRVLFTRDFITIGHKQTHIASWFAWSVG